MSFLEEIEEMKNNRNDTENRVVNEIVDYFKEKMNNDKFKEYLKEYIKKAINNGKTNCNLRIEFWEYSSGCSDTFIYVPCCGKFELKGEEKYEYKGIRLKEIHKRICTILSDLFKTKIKELGLKVINSERLDNNYRFGYYVEDITISW
jgi:hypothetical protein